MTSIPLPAYQGPTPQEAKQWLEFVKQSSPKIADIPFAFPVGSVTIVGVLYARDPLENSSAEGTIFGGGVVGTFHVDRNRNEVCAYDPSGFLARACVLLDLDDDIDGRRLLGKFEHRELSKGGWSTTQWQLIYQISDPK